MAAQGVGTYKLNAFWESGRLIYYEKAYGHTTTGDVFILGHDYVQVGDTANDVDFAWKGTTTGTFTLDAAAHTLALTGMATSTDGAVTITNATATSSTTTGALIVTGGIATAADIFCGDDLFFASGAVLNFNAGDVTITHGSNTLAFAGASSGVTFDGLTTVTVASLNATTGRIAKFDGTVLTPNFGDGYGAIECNLNIGTGAVAGRAAVASVWVNFAAGTTFVGSSNIAPLDVGIWGPSAMTMTGSKLIMGMNMSCVIDDGANPGSLYLFSTNISANALTAIFDLNTKVDFLWVTGVLSNASGAGHIPLFVERSTGVTHYINTYIA